MLFRRNLRLQARFAPPDSSPDSGSGKSALSCTPAKQPANGAIRADWVECGLGIEVLSATVLLHKQPGTNIFLSTQTFSEKSTGAAFMQKELRRCFQNLPKECPQRAAG